MKVFWAEYYYSCRLGTYDKYNTVVVAETKSTALGLLLHTVVIDKIPDTKKEYWELTEIDINKSHVFDEYVKINNY